MKNATKTKKDTSNGVNVEKSNRVKTKKEANMKKIIINTKEDLKTITAENYKDCVLSEALEYQIICEGFGVTAESMGNLEVFADKDFQEKYEALGNADKIALLKPLWDKATLPAIQLKEIGYDALSKIESSPLLIGNAPCECAAARN
jgi:hypothetical protein